MKLTDYAPRAAPFDTYLKGLNLVGVEIGVDVGAHAEAILRYCPVAMLTLVDPWPNPYCKGYCEGRLARFRGRFVMRQSRSLHAANATEPASLDFVYIDQEHDAEAVAADLRAWWPAVKPGGVLGYRNYVDRTTPLVGAVDLFVRQIGISPKVETGEIVLVKP